MARTHTSDLAPGLMVNSISEMALGAFRRIVVCENGVSFVCGSGNRNGTEPAYGDAS